MGAELKGYLRKDGRKGIRNHVVVVYLVECAHHVAREIALPYRDQGVHVLGFGGCYPNDYSQRMLGQLCTHPNVGAVLLVSLGCEGFDRAALQAMVAASGRTVELIHIQNTGGTRKSCERGRAWVEQALADLATQALVPMGVEELIVGTICGGSDSTSGITADPAIGLSFDRLVKAGATVIFEETGELIGCEDVMASRAKTPELGQEIRGLCRKGGTLLHRDGAWQFRPWQCGGRPDNAGGKITRRVCEEWQFDDLRHSLSQATCQRRAASICSMSCPMAKSALVSRISTTTLKSLN